MKRETPSKAKSPNGATFGFKASTTRRPSVATPDAPSPASVIGAKSKPTEARRGSVDQGEGSRPKNIQVCVRLRPLNEREKRHCQIHAWTWDHTTITQSAKSAWQAEGTPQRDSGSANARPQSYKFDHLFFPDSTTQDIYNDVVRNVVLATMEGYHGTVFAYGQTSTGKSFSMQGTEKHPGITPLAVQDCFEYVRSTATDKEFLFRVSYLEIYNENINDLLSTTSHNVKIYEQKGNVTITGVREEVVVSAEQVYALITSGEMQRHVGSTDANKASSRSHTIFRMVIESSMAGQRSVVSTLSLVDLAGSESVKLAGTTGDRQMEGAFINRSLLTLGKVIGMLTDEAKESQHVPYRDSKLTRMLQPSLRGDAQIAIICTATPSLMSMEETHNTLKFASRAKKIKSHAQVNEVVDEKMLLNKYRHEIQQLKQQLAQAQAIALSQPPLPPGAVLDLSSSGAAVVKVPVQERALQPVREEDEKADEGELRAMIAHLERLILKSKVQASPRGRNSPDPEEFGWGRGVNGGLGEQEHAFFETRKPSANSGRSRRPSSGAGDEDHRPPGGEVPGVPQGGPDWGAVAVSSAGAPGEAADGRAQRLSRSPDQTNGRLAGTLEVNSPDRVPATSGAGQSLESPLRTHLRLTSLGGGVPEDAVTPGGLKPSAPGAALERLDSQTVEISEELEHLHMKLRSMLRSRRIKKGGGQMHSPPAHEVEELRARLQNAEIDKSMSQADSQFLQKELEEKERDIRECMDLLEDMEARHGELEEEAGRVKGENSQLQHEIAALQDQVRIAREDQLAWREEVLRSREVQAELAAENAKLAREVERVTGLLFIPPKEEEVI